MLSKRHSDSSIWPSIRPQSYSIHYLCAVPTQLGSCCDHLSGAEVHKVCSYWTRAQPQKPKLAPNVLRSLALNMVYFQE